MLKAQLKNLNQNVEEEKEGEVEVAARKNINEINRLIVSFGNDSVCVYVHTERRINKLTNKFTERTISCTCDLIHVVSKYLCNTHLYVIFVVYVCAWCVQ